jgi:hypothetical protein
VHFFKEHQDFLLVSKVRKRASAVLLISIVIIFGLTIAASAFYFNFQYFETDKLVYEVGETIEMAARLIADFGPEGWCYVSFSAVTDLGPVFADEYFIPPLPSARIVNSSYNILPEDTNPGESGSQVFVLFSAETFDTVSQGAEDSVEVSIVRGHLTVTPLSSLIVQSSTQTTISLRVTSIHNDNVPYRNEEINIEVKNPASETVLNDNLTTGSDGSFSLNWNNSMGLLGTYDLVVTGFGNDDFLGFSKTFQIEMMPATANLTIISAPEYIQCQSPDGSHYESADIVVRHESANQTHIDDSIVYWNATFGNGLLSNLGNGDYSTSIDFRVIPGVYNLNITAINLKFQTTSITIAVAVIKNILHFLPASTDLLLNQGSTTALDFIISEDFNWGNNLTIEFSDLQDEILIRSDVTPSHISSVLISGWHNLSLGSHILHPYINSDYYEFASDTSSIQLMIFGILKTNITVVSAYYGESLEVDLKVCDANNLSIDIATVTAYHDNETLPFAILEQVNMLQIVSIELPLSLSPGVHMIDLEVVVPYYISSSVTLNLSIWMKTNMTIIIGTSCTGNQLDSKHLDMYMSNYLLSTTLRSSSGSIMRPPPILLSGTTSTESLTTRETSLDI